MCPRNCFWEPGECPGKGFWGVLWSQFLGKFNLPWKLLLGAWEMLGQMLLGSALVTIFSENLCALETASWSLGNALADVSGVCSGHNFWENLICPASGSL